MTDTTKLTAQGHDSWDRPVFQHEDGKWYCCVDLDATLEDVNMGRAALYAKCDGRESEPDYPVRLAITEPPTPPGYIIKQDGIFGEWTAIRDNDLGEIIACGCETRTEAVRHAERDGGLPHTQLVAGGGFYMSIYPGTMDGFYSLDGTVATAKPLSDLRHLKGWLGANTEQWFAFAKKGGWNGL